MGEDRRYCKDLLSNTLWKDLGFGALVAFPGISVTAGSAGPVYEDHCSQGEYRCYSKYLLRNMLQKDVGFGRLGSLAISASEFHDAPGMCWVLETR